MAWEAGSAEPTLAALRELASYYGMPLGVFLLSSPPVVPPRPIDLRVFPGARLPELSIELAKALNRATAIQAVAEEMLRETGGPAFVPGQTDRGDFEALARAQRDILAVSLTEQHRWRDDHAALRTWRQVIEVRHVFVLQLPMPRHAVRAFSLSQRPPVIVLNQSDYVRARIFSLFHEYAHVLLGTGAICMPGVGRLAMERTSAVEVFCNRFAGALLVPGDALKVEPLAARVGERGTVPDDDTLDALARRFHVSRGVVWYRLRDVGMIAADVFAAKWDEWADFYPPPPTGGGGMTTAERVVTTYGSNLPQLLLAAAKRNIVTRADVGQYLRVGVRHLGDIEAEAASRAAG
jgi:Zn-dependent peptidase ImmA (M78 family)